MNLCRSTNWLAALGATLAFAASASGLSSNEPFLLHLDDHTYPLPAGSLVFSSSGQITLQTPLALSQCQRRSGGALVVSAYKLVYDGLGRFLYLRQPVLSVDGGVLRLESSSGDLVCAGGSPAAEVFRSSFE